MPDPAAIFKRLDRNGDKELSLDEFVAGMKRLHEGMAAARQGFAAAMQHRGPMGQHGPMAHRGPMPQYGHGPGSMAFGNHPGGPPWAGPGMMGPHVGARFASLPPEARKKAFEAMKEHFRDRGAAEEGPHRHGPEARSHERGARDHDRGDAKEHRGKPRKERAEKDDD